MKRIWIALMTAIVLTLVLCIGAAAETPSRVEISFKVGDSVLNINGEDVATQTPYVVGGTTLVPLRVITEAFGADVAWEGETKTVTIAYKGIELILQIGNTQATVSGNPISLLLAPELQGSTTMVPLRFISENFGADVTYDDETKAILVVKDITESNSIVDYSLLLKKSDKEKIGDSFMGGWSIDRSDKLILTERSFDGTDNEFTVGTESGVLSIAIEAWEDDDITPEKNRENAENELEELRELSDYSTVQLFKLETTPSGVPYAHVSCRMKGGFYNATIDRRVYYHGKYRATVNLMLDESEKSETVSEWSRYLDSFDFVFDPEITEDLSDVEAETGMHYYENKTLGIKLAVPGSYGSYGSTENRIFLSDMSAENIDVVQLQMYSVQEERDYLAWAKLDYAQNKGQFRESLCDFSELKQTQIDDHAAAYYEYRYPDGAGDTFVRDIFIDGGAYYYNVAVVTYSDKKDTKVPLDPDSVINSIAFTEPDAEELGIMLRTDEPGKLRYDDTEMLDGEMTARLPKTWDSYEYDSSFYAYSDTGFSSVEVTSEEQGRKTLKKAADEAIKTAKQQDNVKVEIFSQKATKIAGFSAYYIAYTVTETHEAGDEPIEYTDNTYLYIIEKNDRLITVNFTAELLHDGQITTEIRETFFNSLKFN